MSDIKTQNMIGIKGAYSYQLIDDKTGGILADIPEQDNLILDTALDKPGHAWGSTYIVVGSGVVTPPTVTDTDMGNEVAMQYASFSNVNAECYVTSEFVMTVRSATADFTGLAGNQISEIGVKAGDSIKVLFTRALIKDANGNVSPISIGAGQTLRITYKLYYKTPIVLARGVLGTVHGDFHWMVGMGGTISKYNGYVSDFTYTGSAYLGLTNSASNPYGYISSALDIPNRKVIFTGSFGASPDDRILTTESPNNDWPTISPRYHPGDRAVLFVRQAAGHTYTLPANYNFSITWEVTWGRLP